MSLATETGGDPRGSLFTYAQLVLLASSVGFANPKLAAAIAMAESGGWTAIRGDNGDSIGLWQINLPAHPQYSAADLENPLTNARAALAISGGGRDFSRGWYTTWTTGTYRRWYGGGPQWLAAATGAGLAGLGWWLANR